MPKISNLELSESVAIVGSSATLLEREYAEEIDSHTDVIRFNRAPVEGWEKFVGAKTTVRFANGQSFMNLPFKRKDWDPIGQPTNFIKDQRNCKIVYMGFNDGIWAKRDQHLHESCEPYLIVRSHIAGNLKSIGYETIEKCINAGIVPDVYGFGVGEPIMTHYWEKRDNTTPCHDFSIERANIQRWHDEGKIKLHL